MPHRRPPVLLVAAALLLVALVALPVVTLLARALAEPWWQQLSSPVAWSALRLSLLTTSVAMGIVIAFGTPLAFLLARYRFRGQALLEALIDLPTVLPPVVAGVALLLVFGRSGWLGRELAGWGIGIPFTSTAVVLAQVFVAAPFFVRALKVAFDAVPRELEEAARSDGASGWTVFLLITAPLALRGFVEGTLLAWSRALGEFGATVVFAGSFAGRTRTLPLAIYAELERDLGAAVVLSALLTVVAAALFMAVRGLAPSQLAARPAVERRSTS